MPMALFIRADSMLKQVSFSRLMRLMLFIQGREYFLHITNCLQKSNSVRGFHGTTKFGFSHLIIESDFLTLVNMVQKGGQNPLDN